MPAAVFILAQVMFGVVEHLVLHHSPGALLVFLLWHVDLLLQARAAIKQGARG